MPSRILRQNLSMGAIGRGFRGAFEFAMFIVVRPIAGRQCGGGVSSSFLMPNCRAWEGGDEKDELRAAGRVMAHPLLFTLWRRESPGRRTFDPRRSGCVF